MLLELWLFDILSLIIFVVSLYALETCRLRDSFLLDVTGALPGCYTNFFMLLTVFFLSLIVDQKVWKSKRIPRLVRD